MLQLCPLAEHAELGSDDQSRRPNQLEKLVSKLLQLVVKAAFFVYKVGLYGIAHPLRDALQAGGARRPPISCCGESLCAGR